MDKKAVKRVPALKSVPKRAVVKGADGHRSQDAVVNVGDSDKTLSVECEAVILDPSTGIADGAVAKPAPAQPKRGSGGKHEKKKSSNEAKKDKAATKKAEARGKSSSDDDASKPANVPKRASGGGNNKNKDGNVDGRKKGALLKAGGDGKVNSDGKANSRRSTDSDEKRRSSDDEAQNKKMSDKDRRSDPTQGSVKSDDEPDVPGKARKPKMLESFRQKLASKLKAKEEISDLTPIDSEDILDEIPLRDVEQMLPTKSGHIVNVDLHRHGYLGRTEAENMLKKPNDWLVRRQKIGDRLCVSVKTKNGFMHLRLHAAVNGLFSIKSYYCMDLDVLVNHIANYPEDKLEKAKMRMQFRAQVKEEVTSIHSHAIKMGEMLGAGNFGSVNQGTLKRWNGKVKVALKTLKLQEGKMNVADDVISSLLREAYIMHDLKHENVLRMYGIRSSKMPLMIVMELAAGNSLLNRLHAKDGTLPKPNDLSRWALEIAAGMTYLQESAVVHRDLAARNCLLSRKGAIKISDFGLSIKKRPNFKYEPSGPAPIRWMAPETLVARPDFTHKSDVWSFGVVLYEIYSNGTRPYIGSSNAKVRKCVLDGTMRLEAPKGMPADISDLMSECFLDEKNRPHFVHVKRSLTAYRSTLGFRGILKILHKRTEGAAPIAEEIEEPDNATTEVEAIEGN